MRRRIAELVKQAHAHQIKEASNVERFIRLGFALGDRPMASTILKWDADEAMKIAALEKRAQEEAFQHGE